MGWLYDKYLLNGKLKVLRREACHMAKKETRGKFNKRKFIRKRDKSLYRRAETGHWEVDTCCKWPRKEQGLFCNICGKKNPLLYRRKNARQESNNHGQNHYSNAGSFSFSITCDRGTEFATGQR